MKFFKVQQSIIVLIAAIVSVLLNLPQFIDVLTQVNKLDVNPWTRLTITLVYVFLMSWLLLQLNSNLRYKFKSQSIRLEIMVIISNGLVGLLSVYILTFLYPFFTGTKLNEKDIIPISFGTLIVIIVLFFVSRVLRYQLIHKQDVLEKERLKTQSLQNELMALKNQINPHFLFNSLNSLSSLIRDNDKATVFVNKLSLLYRYILQSSEVDLVTLQDELDFLENYVYLIKVRYRTNVEVLVNVDNIVTSKKIPVLSLQLLVENAVKHNEVSSEHPLKIKITNNSNYIIVSNPIRHRLTIKNTTGKGLANINKRYVLLKDKPIQISDLNNIFTVKLPL